MSGFPTTINKKRFYKLKNINAERVGGPMTSNYNLYDAVMADLRELRHKNLLKKRKYKPLSNVKSSLNRSFISDAYYGSYFIWSQQGVK